MVHPLVRHHQGPFHLTQMGDGVLCEYREPIGRDQFRDPVVDLRIHVVRPAGQHHCPLSCLLQPCKGFLTLFLHVQAGCKKFLPGRVGSHPDLSSGDLPPFCEFLYQGIGEHLLIGKCHKGIDKGNMLLLQCLHIVFDILSIGGDHGAVVVVACIRAFIALIWNAWIKYKLDPLFDQPGYVAVHQLGGITLGLAGNGFNPQLIELSGGLGGKHHMVAQLLEKYGPEGEILIHVEDTRDPHRAAVRLV